MPPASMFTIFFQNSDAGRHSADPHEQSWTVYADPQILSVNRHALLETTVGTWLSESGHYTKLVLFCMISILVAFFIPGGEQIHATVELDDGQTEVKSTANWTWSPYKLLPICIAYLALMFLAGHRVNRELFGRTLMTFEFFMVFTSMLSAQVLGAVNFLSIFHDHVTIGWYVLRIAAFVMYIPAACIVAAIDSLRVHRCSKLMINTLIVVYYSYSWIQVMFLDSEFSSKATCILDVPCGIIKDAHLSLSVNIIVFLIKANRAYVQSHCAFATLRPRYLLTDPAKGQINLSPSIDLKQASLDTCNVQAVCVVDSGASAVEVQPARETTSDEICGQASHTRIPNGVASGHAQISPEPVAEPDAAPDDKRKVAAEVEAKLSASIVVRDADIHDILTSAGGPAVSLERAYINAPRTDRITSADISCIDVLGKTTDCNKTVAPCRRCAHLEEEYQSLNLRCEIMEEVNKSITIDWKELGRKLNALESENRDLAKELRAQHWHLFHTKETLRQLQEGATANTAPSFDDPPGLLAVLRQHPQARKADTILGEDIYI